MADPWSDSYDPSAKTRFIPVELWTGSPWDGVRTINLPKADLHFDGTNKHITGPLEWTDSIDGTTRLVYLRYTARDPKTQRFAVREDETGIGRVDDSRWQREIQRGESKFPLGLWTQGETRVYPIEAFGINSKKPISLPMQVTIIMENIEHRYAGNDHCMTFRWRLTIRERLADNNAYTYCPGKGLASLDDD